MKTKIEFEVDFYEDKEFLHNILMAQDYSCMISDAKNLIRTRLKHGQDVSDSEVQFLEELSTYLEED